MVKKVQKTSEFEQAAKTDPTSPAAGAAPASLLDGQFAQLVKESAQQIWSAGLAAFAKAQGNGGKVFDHLAAEGAKLQKSSQQAQASAEERLGAVASRMTDMAGEVGTRAGQHWDKLESIFEDRVARALHRLGVPSAQDLATLSARLDALTAALAPSPGEAAKSAKSANTVKTTTSVKPAKPAKSAEPAKPAKSAKSAKPAKSTEAAAAGGAKSKAKAKSTSKTETAAPVQSKDKATAKSPRSTQSPRSSQSSTSSAARAPVRSAAKKTAAAPKSRTRASAN